MDKWTIKKCKTLTILQNKADLISAVQSFVSSMDHIYTGAGQYTLYNENQLNITQQSRWPNIALHCIAWFVFMEIGGQGSESACHILRH